MLTIIIISLLSFSSFVNLGMPVLLPGSKNGRYLRSTSPKGRHVVSSQEMGAIPGPSS